MYYFFVQTALFAYIHFLLFHAHLRRRTCVKCVIAVFVQFDKVDCIKSPSPNRYVTAIRAVKLLQHVIVNLNFKGSDLCDVHCRLG